MMKMKKFIRTCLNYKCIAYFSPDKLISTIPELCALYVFTSPFGNVTLKMSSLILEIFIDSFVEEPKLTSNVSNSSLMLGCCVIFN